MCTYYLVLRYIFQIQVKLWWKKSGSKLIIYYKLDQYLKGYRYIFI